MVGVTIGPYRVLEKLGEGGMGEVYRARDTKLGRDVAIKILPADFADDPERIARFLREAQVLAALNHQHIAQLYGFEEGGAGEGDRARALVMELVEGSTLADRLAHGPIPINEALPIARQIAEALHAAHDKGITHRDLKPANVALTLDGDVKVLDFGLAKPAGGGATSAVVASATITSPALMTSAGTILGTAAYMSPEQAKGAVADKRSDVWAFGCVLYEMLTGRRAFDGGTVTETLALVLTREPDWLALPSDVPAVVRTLLEGCLAKDPRKRVADVSVAEFLLEERNALQLSGHGAGPSVRQASRAPCVDCRVAGGRISGRCADGDSAVETGRRSSEHTVRDGGCTWPVDQRCQRRSGFPGRTSRRAFCESSGRRSGQTGRPNVGVRRRELSGAARN